MSNKRRRAIVIMAVAAAVIITAAAMATAASRGKCTLTLSDEDSGQVYLELPVSDGERFSVTFIHSVNQTPVSDTYEVRGTDIYVVETRFYNFGAGMQTEYPEGVTYTYAEDGAIVATGYNILCRDLIYCVGKVSDHVLELGGEEYSLRELCGRGTLVRFGIEKE